LACTTGLVAILIEDSYSGDAALGCQLGLIHAVATFPARIGSVGKFVDHHSLEDIALHKVSKYAT
tara:strand:- start:81 stop:275 length:195 start_codon:yes stop_codon:yes gene_type:complete